MMKTIPLHIVIISWVGMGDRARRIAGAVVGRAGRLTVVYSNPEEAEESGPGDWVQVPNAQFFGRKFETALARHDDGPMLLIHADTHYDDWPGLVDVFRAAVARHPSLGIWSPDFTHTGWTTPAVAISAVPGTTLVNVVQTDAIIIGMAPAVVDRMKRLDYRRNNLGWGIGWAAVACAYANGMLVLRDTGLMVEHLVSRGYGAAEAAEQMNEFLTQLTEAERVQVLLLRSWHQARRQVLSPGRVQRAAQRLRWLKNESLAILAPAMRRSAPAMRRAAAE